MKFQQCRQRFDQYKIDALLVSNPVNVSYLMGQLLQDAWILVTGSDVFYLTDSRYVEQIRKKFDKKVLKVVDHDGNLSKKYIDLVKRKKCLNVGFDGRHLSFEWVQRLKRNCGRSIKLKNAYGLIEQMRVIKTSAEILQIKRVLGVHKKAYQYLKRIVKPGIREIDILVKLKEFIAREHVEFAFPPIIAAGENAAFPHAKVTERKIRITDALLIDIGFDVNGYKSDLTRMFLLDKIPPLIRQTIDVVRLAQQEAIAQIRAGVPVARIDSAARDFLKTHKLAQYFTHAVGHGVGLEIHESPRLSQRSSEILKTGMIVTIEPGIYVPGKFGVRLEEMVLVKEQKGEVLSDDIN